ncbi:MAG: tail fiber domain-containing protein, partial [Dysgonamonadaceae bacterium]|nr:tail fiber domain-containing protein [Dysgonamonadaceae bacterium]
MNGQVNINNVQDNYGYSLLVGGFDMLFSANSTGSQYLRFQIGTSNPRISGTGNCVVFYDGRTSIFNDIQIRNLYNYSDRNAKSNILPLFNSLDKVKSLNPITFDWKNSKQARKSEAGIALQEIGFLAQDVEQILPELVVEDEDGNKLINYTGVIPVLTDAIKELSAKIDQLEKDVITLKMENSQLRSDNQTIAIEVAESSKPKLYQNTPNPSSGKSSIKYSVPVLELSAQICIFDLNGKLILAKDINHIGEGEITISSNELTPG